MALPDEFGSQVPQRLRRPPRRSATAAFARSRLRPGARGDVAIGVDRL